MRAIILAAGYATRLYPLTIDKPKALLPVRGKPIIDYIIEKIEQMDDVTDITVVSNDKFADAFYAWAKTRYCEKPITVLNDGSICEEDRKGAIGDIYFALSERRIDEDVIIIAGDNLFTFELTDCYAFFKKTSKDVVVAKEISDKSILNQFAIAVLDADGKVLELIEKPQNPPSSTAVFATYLYKKETLPLFKQYLDEGNKPDAPGYFVQWLYKRKDVFAFRIDGECYDVGTVEAYNMVREIFE